jgi:hypothetical protein
MYTIKLQDGTLIENLGLNGNNYISNTIIDDDVFIGNLGSIIITDNYGNETWHSDMKLMSNIERDGKSWFVLGEKLKSEIKEEILKQTISDLLETMIENGVI